MDLINKRVYCTADNSGSTQGIGKSTAIKLAEMGASVVLISRNKERLENVKLKELPVVNDDQKHEILVADFSNPPSLKKALEGYMLQDQTIHVLVNNTEVLQEAL